MKFGDLYYQEMDPKDAIEKAIFIEERPERKLKNQHELDCFARDNLN